MPEAFRIGFVTPYYPPRVIGGMELSLWHLADTLAAAGHTVRVFTLNYGNGTSVTEGDNLRVYRFGWASDARLWPTKNPWAFRRFADAVVASGERLDLIDAYSLFPPGVIAARRLGIPAVVSVRDAAAIDRGTLHPRWLSGPAYIRQRLAQSSAPIAEFLFSLYGLYLRDVDGRAIASADGATFVSDALRRLFPKLPRHTSVVGSIAFRAAPIGPPPAIRGVDFARDDVVVYAGRLGLGKGVRALREAAEQLLARGRTNLKFLFLGSGPLESELRQSPRRERIIVGGRRSYDETLRALRAARLTVVPSQIFEGFPRVAVESIALGTPVVGTDAGGISEAIGAAGQVVPVGDTGALARAIASLAPDGPARQRALAALPEQAGWSTPEAVLGRVLAFYRSLL